MPLHSALVTAKMIGHLGRCEAKGEAFTLPERSLGLCLRQRVVANELDDRWIVSWEWNLLILLPDKVGSVADTKF